MLEVVEILQNIYIFIITNINISHASFIRMYSH